MQDPKIEALSFILGTLGVLCWMFSLYPQIYKNHVSKSVVGLSLDFVVFHALGHFCYMIYNTNLYWNEYLILQYKQMHSSTPDVRLSDVLFSCHSLLIALVLVIQSVIYERGNQKVSWICKGLVVLTLVSIIVEYYMARFQLRDVTWVDFISVLASIKIILTVIKYVPQTVIMIWGKNVSHLSIHGMGLDFGGGFFSVAQVFLDNVSTFEEILLARRFSPKFTLGVVSMFFNLIYMYLFWKYHITDSSTNDLDNEIAPSKKILTNNLISQVLLANRGNPLYGTLHQQVPKEKIGID